MELEQITEEVSTDSQHRAPPRKKKERLFTVCNIIGIILCVLLLPGFLISSTLLVSSIMHPDIPPSCFDYTPLMVETGSMIPLFDEDDLVIVRNTPDNASYNVGDVVCFHSGNVYITHRINEIVEGSGKTVYKTKGDANNTPDKDTVSPEQILGIYVTHFDGMGRVLMFIQTPVGMMLCVMLPIFLVLLLFLLPSHIKSRKGKSPENGEN